MVNLLETYPLTNTGARTRTRTHAVRWAVCWLTFALVTPSTSLRGGAVRKSTPCLFQQGGTPVQGPKGEAREALKCSGVWFLRFVLRAFNPWVLWYTPDFKASGQAITTYQKDCRCQLK